MRRLQLGVLGPGEGRSIISGAIQSDLWEVRVICDLNESLCRDMATVFSLPEYTTRYDKMLGNSDIDVIGIYTPDHLHSTHIPDALNAGKHVICTKPFVIDLKDGRSIPEASKRTGRHVFAGQSCRFFEPMIRQRSAFDEGGLGDLITIEAAYNADLRWFLKKGWIGSEEFKWLFGGLNHPIDLVRWYLPDITEVTACGCLSSNGLEHGLKNPDIMHLLFKSRNGRIARVSDSYSCPLPPEQRTTA